jgi:hypothetical protein
MSLARHRRGQGRLREARDLLAPVYGWFTEVLSRRRLRLLVSLVDRRSLGAERGGFLAAAELVEDRSSPKFIEQRLRILQIWRIKTLLLRMSVSSQQKHAHLCPLTGKYAIAEPMKPR